MMVWVVSGGHTQETLHAYKLPRATKTSCNLEASSNHTVLRLWVETELQALGSLGCTLCSLVFVSCPRRLLQPATCCAR